MSWWLCCSVCMNFVLIFRIRVKMKSKKKYKIKSMTDFETKGSKKKFTATKKKGERE